MNHWLLRYLKTLYSTIYPMFQKPSSSLPYIYIYISDPVFNTLPDIRDTVFKTLPDISETVFNTSSYISGTIFNTLSDTSDCIRHFTWYTTDRFQVLALISDTVFNTAWYIRLHSTLPDISDTVFNTLSVISDIVFKSTRNNQIVLPKHRSSS